jgi:hypothetical protein
MMTDFMLDQTAMTNCGWADLDAYVGCLCCVVTVGDVSFARNVQVDNVPRSTGMKS